MRRFNLHAALRVLLALCAAFAIVLTGTSAWAQITITMEPEQLNPEAGDFVAGQVDCNGTAGWRWVFGGLTDGENVEVWASEAGDCSLAVERGATGNCDALNIQATAATMSASITVPVSAVAPVVTGVTDCVDTSGGDNDKKVTVYFLVDPGGTDVTNFLSQEITLDLKGPPPPTAVTAGAYDENGLAVSWKPPTGTTEVTGYTVYAMTLSPLANVEFHPLGGPGGAGGAGGGVGGAMGGAAGMGGGGGMGGATGGSGTGASPTTTGGGTTSGGGEAPSEECSHPEMVPGEIPTAAATKRGDTSSTNLDIEDGLVLGTVYVVGVASKDAVGNVGEMSEVVCASPEPVDDFWKDYNALSDAGGGFCRCALVGGPTDASLAALLATLVGVAFWFRRRKDRA